MTTQVSGHHKKGITIYDIAVTALFAALCYVATTFFKIEIPTPVGRMMMHAGNIFCLLAALLLGPARGAAADAIGMGLSDILSVWIASAPSTIVMRFCMGLVTGAVPKLGGGTSKHSMKWVIIGAVSGMFTYYVLYLGYSFLKDLILGNAVATCLADVGVKAVTSGITGILSVIAACLLYIPFHKALTAAGYYRKR